MINAKVSVVLLMLSITGSAFGDIYKNVDSNGNITYSDVPASSNSELVRITPTRTIAQPQQSKTTTAPATTAGKDTTAPQVGASTIAPIIPTTTPSTNTKATAGKASTAASSSLGGGGASSGGSAAGGAASSSGSAAHKTGVQTTTSTTAGAAAIENKTTTGTTTGDSTIGPPTTTAPTTDPLVISFVGQNKVKWHPGHYLLVYPQDSQSDAQFATYTSSVIKGVSETPGLQGIQKQYFWNKLEPSKGVYDFSEIRRDLAALRVVNKHLIISFQERSFIDGKNYAPSYLMTSEYGGGVYSFNSGKGYNVNYWNVNVQDRLIALINELGRQFNSHPNLEALNFEESSHSNRDEAWKTKYSTLYYTGVIRVAQAAKQAFPNTVVLQYINYADWNMPRLVSAVANGGIGVGGPDTSEFDVNLLNTSYEYIRNLAGTLPVGMAVQYLNYEYNNGKGPVNPPEISSIHTFAQNYLKANYIFWMRRTAETWNGSNYYQDVLNHLKTIDWNKNNSGGLSTACPQIYESCSTN